MIIFLTGYRLSRGGQPYNSLLSTIHKLVSVGAIVFLVMTIIKINHASALNTGETIACFYTGARVDF